MGEISHNCGFCVAHSLPDVYSFINSLQHRGRDATGIAAVGDKIDVIKWEGSVDFFDIQALYRIFPASDYHTFMAHVRYATKGRKDEVLKDAHPHVIGGNITHMIDRDHVIIRDCEAACVHNGQVSDEYLAEVDGSLLKTACDTEAMLHVYRRMGEVEFMRQIPGAYTMAIADRRLREVIVMRDRMGIKPGVLGEKDEKYVAASEDIALRKNHANLTEDLEPGTVYYMDPAGRCRKERVVKPFRHLCFFEPNYIANVDSIINGVSVRRVRQLLGEQFAEEFNPNDVDIVSFIPRCPEPAARSYAERTGRAFDYLFYKKTPKRSFMGPTSDERENSIRENLNLVDTADVEGRTILLIDDSMVRGTNIRRASSLLFEAGAKKIYYACYTPPIGIIGRDGIPRGCEFGVDMPPKENEHHIFVARGKMEEISRELRIHVAFLSYEGLIKVFESVGLPGNGLCTYCIGGEHPLLQIETA